MPVFYAKATTKELITKLIFDNKLALSKILLEDQEKGYKGSYIVTIEKEGKKRTLKQNDFMWLYIDHIEKETGNLATDLHELFKRKFLPPVPKNILGVEFKLPASTTDLTKQEMSEYLDKISAFTQIPIPEPIKKEFDIKSVYNDLDVPEGEVKF